MFYSSTVIFRTRNIINPEGNVQKFVFHRDITSWYYLLTTITLFPPSWNDPQCHENEEYFAVITSKQILPAVKISS